MIYNYIVNICVIHWGNLYLAGFEKRDKNVSQEHLQW